MIKSVGCDIVDISRIESAVTNPRFFNKVFTSLEQTYAATKTVQTLAGMWAAKEAVAKALGTGISGFSLKDIEILHNQQGQPYVSLHGKALNLFEEMHANNVHVSISHERNYAVAFVVFE